MLILVFIFVFIFTHIYVLFSIHLETYFVIQQPGKSKAISKAIVKPKKRIPSQSSKTPAPNEEPEKESGSVSSTNLGGLVVMFMLMMLMLYAVHCTWVTSNAYSSPSVVLASTNYDG